MPIYTPRPSPALVTPTYNQAVGAAVWPAVNTANFVRFSLTAPGIYRYYNWSVGVQSGNVQVGVVTLSGANRLSYARVMDSGVIACPAAATIRTDLGATLLAAGDYAMYLWADNTTFQTRQSSSSSLPIMRVGAAVPSLASGVPASGSLGSWGSAFMNVALEGDV
jgi:hypothetical protein